MKKIHKYALAPPFIINAPRDTQWLHVGQDSVQVSGNGAARMLPVIWALVDDAAFNVKHTFSCLGTGSEVGEHIDCYIGTVAMEGGQYVVHVFLDKVDMGAKANA